jgi:hypothetical protein
MTGNKMADIIELPDNLIGIEDKESIESFGGHEISHGRATRFHWDKNENKDPVFELYRGGANEKLVIVISRERKNHKFQAVDKNGKMIVSGALDHVMKILDQKLTNEHDESETPT